MPHNNDDLFRRALEEAQARSRRSQETLDEFLDGEGAVLEEYESRFEDAITKATLIEILEDNYIRSELFPRRQASNEVRVPGSDDGFPLFWSPGTRQWASGHTDASRDLLVSLADDFAVLRELTHTYEPLYATRKQLATDAADNWVDIGRIEMTLEDRDESRKKL